MAVQASIHQSHTASPGACPINLDVARLRRAIQDEYVDVRFSERRCDALGGSPSESSAYKFGTEGVTLTARKPAEPTEEARP